MNYNMFKNVSSQAYKYYKYEQIWMKNKFSTKIKVSQKKVNN